MNRDEILAHLETEEAYYLRRGSEEKDQFMRNYLYEKSRWHSDIVRLIRKMTV